MGGIGSGRPTKKDKQLPEKKVDKMTAARKRTVVANLFFKGYQQHEIVEKTGLSKKEVGSAVAAIKEKLKPKTVPELEYYRNKSRKLIGLGLSTAFEILDDESNKKYPYLRLRALQVIKEYAKLSADIDGITGEKMTAGPDRRAGDLMAELKKIAAEGNRKETVKEEQVNADAESATDRPDVEQNPVNEERQDGDGVSTIGVASADNL